MFTASLAVLGSFLVSQVAAHGGVTSYVIGCEWNNVVGCVVEPYWDCQRLLTLDGNRITRPLDKAPSSVHTVSFVVVLAIFEFLNGVGSR